MVGAPLSDEGAEEVSGTVVGNAAGKADDMDTLRVFVRYNERYLRVCIGDASCSMCGPNSSGWIFIGIFCGFASCVSV